MSQIFMGSPAAVHEMYDLHKKLEKAFDLMGGLQQPPHSPDEETARLNEILYLEGEEELEQLARHIYNKLTGNEIVDA